VTAEDLRQLRANPGVIKNLIGLLLFVVCAAGICVPAWAVDWRLGMAVTAVALAPVAWLLATSEG
jgi:hypothetical protein